MYVCMHACMQMFKSLDLVATLTFIIFQNQVWLRLMQQTWSARLPDLEVKLLSMEQSGGVVVKSMISFF